MFVIVVTFCASYDLQDTKVGLIKWKKLERRLVHTGRHMYKFLWQYKQHVFIDSVS